MTGRFAALLALALAAGCTSSPSPSPSPSPGPTPGPGASEAHSGLGRDTSPSASSGDVASVVAGNNAFALELHRRLVEPGKNMMTSPYSVSTALAMLWAGARGDTASQMSRALHFALPQERFHPAANALDLQLQAPSCTWNCNPFTLRIANTAWAQKDFSFVPAYLDTLAVSYGAGVSLLDFNGATEGARQAINDAVARATENRIKDLLPVGSITDRTRLVLTNAVYFKGRWSSEFDARQTAVGPFRRIDGSDVDVPFMHGDKLARGAVQPAYDAVELRYSDSHFAMTLIAPKAGSFEAFEGALDVAGLEAVDAAMADSLVHLSMPKFGFTWGSTSLMDALAAMGMTDAFVCGLADLTGIYPKDANGAYPNGPPCVTAVRQKTFVAVDEEGTEAAAATAVGSSGGSGPPPRPPELTVNIDRPFLFLVRETTTGQAVFLGRVVDPR